MKETAEQRKLKPRAVCPGVGVHETWQRLWKWTRPDPGQGLQVFMDLQLTVETVAMQSGLDLNQDKAALCTGTHKT